MLIMLFKPTPSIAQIPQKPLQNCSDCVTMYLVNQDSKLNHPFYIENHEVTWRQYIESVRSASCPLPRNHAEHPILNAERLADDYPVTGITIDAMQCYIAWMSRRDHVIYRLPTPDEWLYVAQRAYALSGAPKYDSGAYRSGLDEPRDAIRGGAILPAEHGARSPDGLYGLLDNAGEATSGSQPGSDRECQAFRVSTCTRHFVYGLRSGNSKTPFLERKYILDTYSNIYVGFRLAKDR